MIRTRDVTFNEQLLYDDSQPDLANLLQKRADQILEVINVSNSNRTLQEELDEMSDEEDETSDEEDEVDSGGSRQVDAEENQDDDVISTQFSKDDSTPGLPTPAETPEPQSNTTNVEPSSSSINQRLRFELVPEEDARPRQEIIGDVGDVNIVEGRRTRKLSTRRAAYLTDIKQSDTLPALYGAFATGIRHNQKRLHRDELPPPPRSWKELQAHPYKDGFTEAANKEYNDLEQRGTFESVKRTSSLDVIPVTWVFTYKFDTDGYLVKFKARLCVRGDLQRLSEKDTYAATLAAKIFRAMMAIVAAFNLETWQCDAVNAFANSLIDETVYIEFPDGFRQKGRCLLLRRALYGLRRSPLLWLNEFSTTLTSLGLTAVNGESCLFHNDWLIVFFYVDDIVAACRTEDLPKLQLFKEQLTMKYEIKNLGELTWFLGIRVLRDRPQRKLWLCQDSYIDKIASTFHLKDFRPVHTPMSTEDLMSNPEQASEQQVYVYQRKVGSLLYATCITRPDAARASSKLSEFLRNPSPLHEAAVNRAIAYLYQTRTLAIEYSSRNIGSQIVVRASDAAFGDDPVSRKSTEGFIFSLFGGAIDWRSTKQKTVTTSSTEAELKALSNAATESIWWQRFFQDMRLHTDEEHTIGCDNQQTIRLLTKNGPQLNTKLRHVDIHQHWLRQEVQKGSIVIKWVPTTDMTADGLTKALSRQKHESFIRQLNLIDIKTLL